ncbi:HD-GYP domain-containing protein [Desulfitobacterium dichloroeliminans LMG P-21439]|uniref:HD-GYP domain-containing protein n=1 Tax=Desulfitobacterium dichloroeliminans (strain LMG P-21439 / DCA1) TaxID=871963 RepID=L0FAI9_DESDL|nr:HD domain-containing phosphohydrolase [Desulfitobacterium dichloroeliminans]AGA70237.1 HD-GYP domain-containing protein [Desulfitobacterium dichloroeliminans LMG P-21439]
MYGKEIRLLLQDLAWLDDISYYHSLRVGYLMSCFAEVEVGKQFVKQAWVTRNEFVATGLLHDIGKLRWPAEVLLVGDRLKDLEREMLLKVWNHMIEHPLGSAEIVLDYYKKTGNRFWERMVKGVVSHHEAYSGNGYPYKLKGTEIPLLARGLRVFDNYAMGIEVRRYSSAPQDPNVVIKEMRLALGSVYDPFWGEKILDFLETIQTIPSNLDEWFYKEISLNQGT